MQSLKNFLISFAVGLLLFGIFAINIPKLFFPENNIDKPYDNTQSQPDDTSDENNNPEQNKDAAQETITGKTFTAVVGGYDDTTGELDGLVFIKADKENKRFVVAAIPTTLSVVITSTDPSEAIDDTENTDSTEGTDETTETEKTTQAEETAESPTTDEVSEETDETKKAVGAIKTTMRIKDFPLRFLESEKNKQIIDTVHAITGMHIDYYAFFSTDAALKMFNKTQGLYYTVPQDMFYIGTGTQEEPEIDLKAGGQVLNSKQIISLLRFAAYSTDERRNDVKRALLQADFVSEGIKQILKKDAATLISGIGSVLSNCETNFTSTDFKDNFDLIEKFGEYSSNSVVITVDAADPIEYSFTQKLFENYK